MSNPTTVRSAAQRLGDDLQRGAGRHAELERKPGALDLAERVPQRVVRLPEHLRLRHVLEHERRALLRRPGVLCIRKIPSGTVFGVGDAGHDGVDRVVQPVQRGQQLGMLVLLLLPGTVMLGSHDFGQGSLQLLPG